LARMHRLDTAPFVTAGIAQPIGAEAIALSYLDAHKHLYARTKRGAQPLVEWALGWVRRNVPHHRDVACVVHGDPGQFLFADSRLTCIYDFEATHIGDPLHDLAALRVRHGTEPLGADVNHLIAHYARVSGTPVDLPVLSFHTAAFMLASVLALAGPLTDPQPADMQLEYLIWDLMTRRAMLWAIAECMGVTIQPTAPLALPATRSARTGRVLDATLGRIEPASATGSADLAAARTLALWAQAAAAFGPAREQADLDRAAAILGTRPHDWREADIALERFVATAGADQDAALFAYFAAQTEDLVAEALPVQSRLAHYALEPVRL
jgi:phosphotransferase family enzyme